MSYCVVKFNFLHVRNNFTWICHGVCRDVTYLACKSWQVIFRWSVTRSDVLEEVGSLKFFCWSRLAFRLLVWFLQLKVGTKQVFICICVSLAEIFHNAASKILVNTASWVLSTTSCMNEFDSWETPWGILQNPSCSVPFSLHQITNFPRVFEYFASSKASLTVG